MKLLQKKEILILFVLVLFFTMTFTGCAGKTEENRKEAINREEIKDESEEELTPSASDEDETDDAAEEEAEEAEDEAEASEEEKVYNYNTLEVKGLRITEQSPQGIKLEWDALPDTEYYEILRSTQEDDSRTSFTTDFNETFYIDEEIIPGVSYYYTVRGISSVEDTGMQSKESAVVTAIVNLTTPGIELKEAKDGVTITVSKLDGVQGYCIYMATDEKGKYKKIKTQDDLKVDTFTYKSLESGESYYFKARSFYKVGEETYWSSYSEVVSYTVKSSLEAPKISQSDLDTIKSTEAFIIEALAQYTWDWDPNRDLSNKEYEVTHVSFVPGSNISPLIFIVRSKRIGNKSEGIDKIEAFSVYHDATVNLFSYYDGGSYSLFEGYDPVIKMYKDDKGNQFMLGHFKFDNSGASGQMGTLFDGYYKLMNIENGFEVYFEPGFEIAEIYNLNYHSIVGKAENAEDYKKDKKAYFEKVKELDYKETKVAYDLDAGYEERYKAIEKAYKANYKYLDR